MEETRETNTRVVRADDGHAVRTDTHVVKAREGSKATPWLAFMVGALLIALIGFFFINGRVNVAPGANSVEVTVDGPAVPGNAPAAPAAQPAPAAPAQPQY